MTLKHPPHEMRAWTFTTRGLPAEVLKQTILPTPTLPPPLPLPRSASLPEEWILVKVSHASLDPGAIYQMALIPTFMRPKQSIPDMDLAGVVVDVWHPAAPTITVTRADSDPSKGDVFSKTRFAKGDQVAAFLPGSFAIPTGTGALAEYVAFPARFGVPASLETVSMRAGLTARQLILDSGLKKGDTVLVNAAAGGIGSLVVQLARQKVGDEGRVIGVCSGPHEKTVQALGAHKTWDYQEWDIPAVMWNKAAMTGQIFDVVIDCRGNQELLAGAHRFLKEDGIYVSVGVRPTSFYAWDTVKAIAQMKLNEWWPVSRKWCGYGREYKGSRVTNPSLEEQEAVVDMLESLNVVRDSTYEFDQVKEAYMRVQAGHAMGKIVVNVGQK